jgi:hypothetical protein
MRMWQRPGGQRCISYRRSTEKYGRRASDAARTSMNFAKGSACGACTCLLEKGGYWRFGEGRYVIAGFGEMCGEQPMRDTAASTLNTY